MYAATLLFMGAILAPAAFAAPATLAVRQTIGQPTFDCNKAYTDCATSSLESTGLCEQRLASCTSCAAKETACRTNADYSQQLTCTQNAQLCYYQVETPGTTQGVYGCPQAFATCKSAPMENNSFCASQQSSCQTCEAQENSCRTAPNANEAFCSSQAGNCFEDSIYLNGTSTSS